jgi:hypothetical protein
MLFENGSVRRVPITKFSLLIRRRRRLPFSSALGSKRHHRRIVCFYTFNFQVHDTPLSSFLSGVSLLFPVVSAGADGGWQNKKTAVPV